MYFTYKTISLYYEKIGTGSKSIVILPGWGETRSTFSNIIKHFSKKFTIYIIDYPGFGKSSFPNFSLTIFDYTLMIKAFLEELEISDPLLLTHSFGGRIAIILAGYYQFKINKIIMMDSAGIKPKKTFKSFTRQMSYKILKKLLLLLPHKYQKNYLDKLQLIFGSTDYNALPSKMRQTFNNIVNVDLKFYLKDIKSECLLIWGENDEDTPLNDAYVFEKNIKDAALIIFSNCHHFVYLEEPYRIINIIEVFLKEDE